MAAVCDHRTLSLSSSSYVKSTGYSWPTEQQREAAAILQPAPRGKLKRTAPSEDNFGPFCAPLVLPGDELSEDPDYPPQSIQDWMADKDRNEVRLGKNTIYVAAPPAVEPSVSFVKSWSEPKHADGFSVEAPDVEDIAEYLKAFFYGIAVKLLPSSTLCLTRWNGSTSSTPRHIGLNTQTECIRIRTRAARDGIFARQLNLDDLLDAAISILPEDAFALLLLVPFDLYESPDDDFTCGRAYGGSRVAVISTARYHPGLDRHQNVPRLHGWPASHCERYMRACCSEADNAGAARPNKKRKGKDAPSNLAEIASPSHDWTTYAALSPLHAAVVGQNALPSLEDDPSTACLSALWLGRACRTASHELGHCLGIDHCVYWACVMQGTASLKEDARQPPFLCPVDLAKLLYATGASRDDRYLAILAFCNKQPDSHLFAAFAAWIRAQLPRLTTSD
ncbi:hypothetical protein GGX14DRAFT_607651 [Mycena pura]|uniref:Uncharacterized protein n=1 Tax=Mycena pura TaxID=153505 RepID=A0AAD6XZE8_9AGAR|nr:hypothetical protein GGX14DRAFT_607651 [Mycena pura]